MPRENHILSARSLILLTFNWLGEPASSRRVMETAKAYGFSLKSGVFYPELRGLIDEGVLVTVTVPAKALANYPMEKHSGRPLSLAHLSSAGLAEVRSIKDKLSVFIH